MTGYEATLRMFELDEEITKVSKDLSKTKDIKDREVLEAKLDALDVEFITLKHKLSKITLPYNDN